MAHEGALLKGSGGPSTFAFRCRGGCMEWGRLERLIGLGAGGNTAEGRARCNYARSSERRLLPVEGRPSNARGATRTAVGPAGAADRAARDDCAGQPFGAPPRAPRRSSPAPAPAAAAARRANLLSRIVRWPVGLPASPSTSALASAQPASHASSRSCVRVARAGWREQAHERLAPPLVRPV